jgi:hypothetical protein
MMFSWISCADDREKFGGVLMKFPVHDNLPRCDELGASPRILKCKTSQLEKYDEKPIACRHRSAHNSTEHRRLLDDLELLGLSRHLENGLKPPETLACHDDCCRHQA